MKAARARRENERKRRKEERAAARKRRKDSADIVTLHDAFSDSSQSDLAELRDELLGSSVKRMVGADSDADSDACAEIASML